MDREAIVALVCFVVVLGVSLHLIAVIRHAAVSERKQKALRDEWRKRNPLETRRISPAPPIRKTHVVLVLHKGKGWD